MSIINDLIILVEDAKKINLNDSCAKMKGHRRQIISSSLGRLVTKGWISKTKIDNRYYFSVTSEGHKIIDRELHNIKYIKQQNYPKNWQIVIFNIPEKLRKCRDELRRQLINHGFGRLHSAIWFSKQNQKNTIQAILNDLNISQNVIFIDTKEFTKSEEQKIVQKINWDWKTLSAKYNLFIKKCEKFLSSKNKKTYRAKQLIFELVKIIKSDPKLTNDFYKNTCKKQEAIKLYKKVRLYCYN